MFQLETSRLLLRPLVLADAEPLFAMQQDPEIGRFCNNPAPTLEEERRRLRHHIETYYPKHGVGFLAATLRDTRQVMGRCGLLAEEVERKPELEVAYWLGREFWGHGYAIEAVLALARHALVNLGRPRVISLIHPDNLRSLHVAEGAGLTYQRDLTFRGQHVRLYAKSSG